MGGVCSLRKGNKERKKLRNDNSLEEGEKGNAAPENQRDSKPMERQNTENIHAPPSHIATLVSFIPDQSNPEIKATLEKLKPFEYEEDSPEDKNLPNLGPYQLENSSFYEVATDFFGFFKIKGSMEKWQKARERTTSLLGRVPIRGLLEESHG